MTKPTCARCGRDGGQLKLPDGRRLHIVCYREEQAWLKRVDRVLRNLEKHNA